MLFEAQPPTPLRVVDEQVAYLISDILDDDQARLPAMGTGNPLELPFPAAAKTGTTNDFRDNWTMGYTPSLAVGVWTGNTDNSEMIDISGLTGAAPLWNSYMQAVYSNFDLVARLGENGAQPPQEFVRPPGIVEKPLCALTSAVIGSEACEPAGSELFSEDAPLLPPTAIPDEPTVIWDKSDPAVWRVPAVPITPPPVEVAFEIVPEPDEDAPPPQLFCQLNEGTPAQALPPEALLQMFLEPPRNAESLKPAHEWAQANNLAILPTEPCTEDLLALSTGANQTAVWRITSPADGDTVSGVLPIVGTANFNPGDVQFYKIELGIPRRRRAVADAGGDARHTGG